MSLAYKVVRRGPLYVVALKDEADDIDAAGGWEIVAECASNEEAWRFVDKHTDAGRTDYDRANRIRQAFAE